MKPRSDWYTDTDPRALAVFLECQRRMTPSEKVQGMLQLAQAALDTMEQEVRRQNPGLDQRAAFLRTAALHLDRATMIRVYGWDPENAPQ